MRFVLLKVVSSPAPSCSAFKMPDSKLLFYPVLAWRNSPPCGTYMSTKNSHCVKHTQINTESPSVTTQKKRRKYMYIYIKKKTLLATKILCSEEKKKKKKKIKHGDFSTLQKSVFSNQAHYTSHQTDILYIWVVLPQRLARLASSHFNHSREIFLFFFCGATRENVHRVHAGYAEHTSVRKTHVSFRGVTVTEDQLE